LEKRCGEKEDVADDADEPAKPEIPIDRRGIVDAHQAKLRPSGRKDESSRYLRQFNEEEGAEEEGLAVSGKSVPSHVKNLDITNGPCGKHGEDVGPNRKSDDADTPQGSAARRRCGKSLLYMAEAEPEDEMTRECDGHDGEDAFHRGPDMTEIDRRGAG